MGMCTEDTLQAQPDPGPVSGSKTPKIEQFLFLFGGAWSAKEPELACGSTSPPF